MKQGHSTAVSMHISLCLIQVATFRCDDVVPDLVCLAAYALKLVVI